MLRTLQRVQPFGGRVTSVTMRSIFLAGIEGLRPRPAASSRPASPRVSKRLDHIETRFAVVSNRTAIDLVFRWRARQAFVEFVGSRPGEGAVGAFAFGRSRGVVEG